MVIGIIKLKYCLLAHSYDGRFPPFSLSRPMELPTKITLYRSGWAGKKGKEGVEHGTLTHQVLPNEKLKYLKVDKY